MNGTKAFTVVIIFIAALSLAGQAFAVQLRAVSKSNQTPRAAYQNVTGVPSAISNRLTKMETRLLEMKKEISDLKAEISKLKYHKHTFKRAHFGYASVKTVLSSKGMKDALIPFKFQKVSPGADTVKTSNPVY